MPTPVYLSPITILAQYLNDLGVPAAGGQVFTYLGGTVSTLFTTYSDSTGTVPNPNPLTLNQAGRPVAASGAPTEFWHVGGVDLKWVVTDAAGNQLIKLDHIPALNDLTNASQNIATLLASAASSNAAGTGPVAGADLVANAVKSYDVFASVRAANTPIPVAGQTLNIEVQGALTAGDGLGGFFYWSTTATAADDGRTVLKPTTAGSAGRWLRYYPLGVPLIIVKPSDQSVASSTALVNDTTLTATLQPGVYLLRVLLLLAGSVTTTQGYKLELASTLTLNINSVGTGVQSQNQAGSAFVFQQNGTITGTAISITGADQVTGDIVLNSQGAASAGTITIQFAQNASSANATTMKAGSTIMLTRIA